MYLLLSALLQGCQVVELTSTHSVSVLISQLTTSLSESLSDCSVLPDSESVPYRYLSGLVPLTLDGRCSLNHVLFITVGF